MTKAKWKVPFYDVRIGSEERTALADVVRSNWLTMGPKVKEFEAKFSGKTTRPAENAVAVSSATAALHLSLLCADIGPGDEVLCPSLTFVATANVIKLVGATPVFVDIESEDHWNLSVLDLEAKITSRTKAMMVVHYAGFPCRMKEINKLKKKHGLIVIEDSAHACFTPYGKSVLGSIGDFGCFSFFSNKNMTTAEGGLLLTRRKKDAERARRLRSHGISSSTFSRYSKKSFGYEVTEPGCNYRMDEFRAALGIVQLDKLDQMNKLRADKYDYYLNLFREKLPEFIIPFTSEKLSSCYHIFPILLPKSFPKRDRLIDFLSKEGIQTSVHYKPVHTFSAYSSKKAFLPVLEEISNRILTIPFYPHIKLGDIDFVAKQIARFL